MTTRRTLLQYGAVASLSLLDPTIPVHHAHYLKKRGNAVKAPVEVFIIENSGHNWREIGGALRPSLDEIMAKTVAFNEQQLAGGLRK